MNLMLKLVQFLFRNRSHFEDKSIQELIKYLHLHQITQFF